MNNSISSSRASVASATSGVARFGRLGSLVLGGLFALAVLLQVFLAGSAIFDSPTFWKMHVAFGMAIALLPLVFVLLAWLGRLGARALWLSGLAFVLVILQSFLISIGAPMLAALHPVNALIIFALALWLTQRAWQGVRSK